MEATFFTTYPGKALWTLFAIAINAVRLPLWILYYIPRSTRPHRDWSLRQTVAVCVVREYLKTAAAIDMKTPLSLKPGWEGKRWVVLDPTKSSRYVGIVTKDPNIRPERVGNTWWPRVPSQAEKTGLVALHFHGGAYVIGDGRTLDAGFAAKTLVGQSDITHVMCPQYRLALSEDCRFPAQLQDAITCYSHLIFDLGIDPSQIILSGDSAGANLVLALLKYIGEQGKKTGLPKPAAALLWSTWAHPETPHSQGPLALDSDPSRLTDYVSGQFGYWGAIRTAPTPSTGLDIASPYISFLGNAYKTDVPLYISAGECEVLFKDIARLFEDFSAVPGNRVKFQVEEHCVHDTILVSFEERSMWSAQLMTAQVGKLTGFDKEAEQGVRRANVWLREVLASGSNGAKL